MSNDTRRVTLESWTHCIFCIAYSLPSETQAEVFSFSRSPRHNRWIEECSASHSSWTSTYPFTLPTAHSAHHTHDKLKGTIIWHAEEKKPMFHTKNLRKKTWKKWNIDCFSFKKSKCGTSIFFQHVIIMFHDSLLGKQKPTWRIFTFSWKPMWLFRQMKGYFSNIVRFRANRRRFFTASIFDVHINKIRNIVCLSSGQICNQCNQS